MGRQAQMMATFISIMDHMVDAISYVTSGVVAVMFSVVMRMQEVMTTKMPRAKTRDRATFCTREICKSMTRRIGSSRMMVSVVIEKSALAYQFLMLSMQ